MNLDWQMPEGWNSEQVKRESARCLSCKNPQCEKGCPTHMRIRDFIFQIKKDNLSEARKIIDSCSDLPHICSIVCPHERQCEGHCVLNARQNPISIGHLERYVSEQVPSVKISAEPTGKKAAIIGAGPAGISCALELAKKGVHVEIFEEKEYIGGVLVYGIPSYRLEIQKVRKIREELDQYGILVHLNHKMTESDILGLKERFDAVFISIGLTKVKKMRIPNEDAVGVYDALDFLKQVNEFVKWNKGTLPVLKPKTIVVGAGNVAMDAARTALRLNSEVTVVYRRSIEEAPATKKEIEEAEKEGVRFRFLTNPVEIIKDPDGKVCQVRMEKMELGKPDASGRRSPIPTQKFFTMDCDQIISAIGQSPEDIYDVHQLNQDHGYLVCDGLKTNIEGIFAGGDIVFGAKTVVEAMNNGRSAAKMMLNLWEPGSEQEEFR